MNWAEKALIVILASMVAVIYFLSDSINSKNEKIKQLNNDLSMQIAINTDYEKRINSLHELDTKHTTELTNAKAKIDKLRIAAERNPERVYIRASCPKGEGNSISGLDDGTTARPTDSAVRNYWLLRNRIAELTRMILELQDYIRTEC